jgi:hypothetical protein
LASLTGVVPPKARANNRRYSGMAFTRATADATARSSGYASPRISSIALSGSSACSSRLCTRESQNIGAAAGIAAAPAVNPL